LSTNAGSRPFRYQSLEACGAVGPGLPCCRLRTRRQPEGRQGRSLDPTALLSKPPAQLTNVGRRISRWGLTLVVFFLTSCGRAPSFDVLGSFFPAWLACLALGLVLTVAARRLLSRLPIVIALPVLTCPSFEGQISDERRRIAALVSAVSVSQANIQSTEAEVTRSAAAVDQARADVANAEQGVSRANAEWTYAKNNLHRIEPLLVKQFVTVDQVDRARTWEVAGAQAGKQAQSQLPQAQAGLQSMLAQQERSRSTLVQSKAQHEQAQNAVTTLEPLIHQRGAKAAALETARYHLNNCRVYAPFAARVTNLTISEDAYARVAPDADVVGRLGAVLPDVQRTLNGVHLASRFPVRARVENPSEDSFRVSESAVVVIRGR